MPLTRQQTTINERLAKYCAGKKIDVNKWEPTPPEQMNLDMTCINKQLGLKASEPFLDEYSDEVRYTQAQCICGSNLSVSDHMVPIWLPSHDKNTYAMIGIDCFNIWFENGSPATQRKCNAVRKRVAQARCKKPKLTCLTCGKSNSNSHISYATGEYINHHIKCMPMEMRHEFETKYAHHLQGRRTTYKCGVCGNLENETNRGNHNSWHKEFLKACQYRFKNGKHASECMWDVLQSDRGYIKWMEDNGKLPRHFRQMIAALLDGDAQDWDYIRL